MMSRAITLVAAISCCIVRSSFGGDDPLINISMHAIKGSGIEYVWSVRQSRLASLPHCDPLHAEVPVSPHQAVLAGLEFMRSRFPGFEPQSVDLALLTRGLQPNAITSELWMYEISFSRYDGGPAPDHPLSTVTVLMDGKVLVPLEQPEKPRK